MSWDKTGMMAKCKNREEGFRILTIGTKNQGLKVQLLIQGLPKLGECFGQQNWAGKSPENKLSDKISVTCCFQSGLKIPPGQPFQWWFWHFFPQMGPTSAGVHRNQMSWEES